MSERPPLDLDAIMARARKAEVDTVNSLRHDVAAVIDALVGDSLALVARVRELEKMAGAATEVARHIRCEQHADSDYGRRCCIYCALRRALAEAGYEAKP